MWRAAAGRVAIALAAADLALVSIYLADVALGSPSWTLHRLVDLDAEMNVPTWYTSAKLMLAGAAFLLLALRPAQTAVGSRRFLMAVGLVLTALSLDEVAGVHEHMTLALRRFEALPRFTGDHGMWVPFLLIGGAMFLAATARSWRRLWHHERRGTSLLGGGLTVGVLGAVGLEIVSYEVIRPGGVEWLYVLEVAVEEGLEMLGATMLLWGSMHVFLTGAAVVDSMAAPVAAAVR